MWYAKMFFSEGREIFQYDSLGTQGVPDVQKEFPFLESLLTFLEMDYGELTPSLQRIADRWRRLIVEDDRQAGTDAIVELSQLKVDISIWSFCMCVGMTVSPELGFMVTEAVRRMRRYWTNCASSLNSFRGISSRSNAFLSWCWMWTARDGSRRRRRQKITFTTLRKIPTCFVSTLSPSALSRWSRGGVRRCCIPPVSET